jgi:cytochrome P450
MIDALGRHTMVILEGSRHADVRGPTADVVEFLRELTRRGQAGDGPDMVRHLLTAGMPSEEVETVCALTLIGGVDTTVRGLANTVLGALSTPGELEHVPADPPHNAFDEGLRWTSPLQLKGREVRAPVTLHGVELERGRAAIGLLGAANRDPGRHAEPERYDSARRTATTSPSRSARTTASARHSLESRHMPSCGPFSTASRRCRRWRPMS